MLNLIIFEIELVLDISLPAAVHWVSLWFP
jgi:hypothetical protein